MKPTHARLRLCLLLLAACGSLSGCDPAATNTIQNALALAGARPDGASGVAPNEAISDVAPSTDDVGQSLAPQAIPAAVSARVRNESEARVDVTLRFIRGDTVVHLAFVRVPSSTVTTVTSPEPVDQVEMSGVDDGGRALPHATFFFGVDFDEASPAEYVVVNDRGDEPTLVDPDVGAGRPAGVLLHEPAEDTTLPLGSTLRVRWSDTSVTAGAVVGIYLQPVGDDAEADPVPVSPAVGAALDGLNDELVVILQDLSPGLYEVQAQLADGDQVHRATAPGLVELVEHPTNKAPSISLKTLTPSQGGFRSGDSVLIRWEDVDEDQNATITFALESSMAGGLDAETFSIGPPIAEDPDGPSADSVRVTIRDVLPGLYDLVGTIYDGQLTGVDRLERAIRVLPDLDNDAPQLVLVEPSDDVELSVGELLVIEWIDSDANDNARIKLLLDPDVGEVGLDGDEYVLANAIDEDADGAGDRRVVSIAGDVLPGTYEVVGVIRDGSTEVITHGGARVRVLALATDGGDGAGNGNDEDGAGGNGEGGMNGGVNPGADDDPNDDDMSSEWIVIETGRDVTREGAVLLTVQIRGISEPSFNGDVIVRLSNQAYGGDVRINLPRDSWMIQEDATLLIELSSDRVPTEAWPQVFDLELDLLVDGIWTTIVLPEPLWLGLAGGEVEPVTLQR